MSLINKLVGKDLIDLNVRNSILTGRGNIKDFFPPDFTEEEKENISSINGMTMTSIERQVSLIRAIDYLVKNEIPGDIVECGVWKGGSMMLVAKRLLQLNDANRALFLFDTFEGMSEPGERDVNSVDNKTAQELLDKENKLDGNNVWCYSSLEEVKSNLKKTNYSPEKIFFSASCESAVCCAIPPLAVGIVITCRPNRVRGLFAPQVFSVISRSVPLHRIVRRRESEGQGQILS